SRLSGCGITEEGCAALTSALCSNPSTLRELDLSSNRPGDSAVTELSAGLEDPNCKLEKLLLSDCGITEEGCAALASALCSNPSTLRELDLSSNRPGDSAVTELSAGLEDPNCKLEKLLNLRDKNVTKDTWIPLQDACRLTLDPNTANRRLSLCEGNRKATLGTEDQSHPDHPERFDSCSQVLCREGLTGRCYWEAEWSGEWADIGVTYKGISREGSHADCRLGRNDKSWSLSCEGSNCSAWHNNNHTDMPAPPTHRVGVYLDWAAGTLTFYSISSDTLTPLHTFHSTFTEPLYAGFGVDSYSSVSLCQLE
ncbi:STXB protein, partial [Amia calva]|nr:STXB protein [Amia calva]